jgi:hypothetical protein
MASNEDHGKYLCALGSWSVRRVAAKVYAASELDSDERIALLKGLTRAMQAALVGWTLVDNDRDREKNGEDLAAEIDLAVYSDGRRWASKQDAADYLGVSERLREIDCDDKEEDR